MTWLAGNKLVAMVPLVILGWKEEQWMEGRGEQTMCRVRMSIPPC